MKLYKALFLVALLSFCLSIKSQAQLSGTIHVCSSCTYTSLTGPGGAFITINTVGLSSNLIVQIEGDLSEPSTNTLNSWDAISTAPNWTVTIKPDGNIMRTITNTGVTSGGLIRITADRVTIDGRDPGNATLDFTNRYLTFINNDPSSTFNFSGDATFNVIRSSIIKGSNTSLAGGVISFGGGGSGSTATGNDNNAIQYCDITNAATSPRIGIYSLGSAKSNDNITISNNRIYNFYYDDIGAFRGIYLSTNNSNWLIDGNSFFQESTLTSIITNQRDVYAIHVNNTGYHTIKNNFIGGDSPGASITSQPWTVSYANATLRVGGIWIESASASQQSIISKNVITNLSIANNSAVLLNDVFFGINVGIASNGTSTTGCLCSVEDNYIGSKADGTGTITITDAKGAIAKAIDAGGSKKTDILRNTIENISISAPEDVTSAALFAIDFSNTSVQYSDIIRNNIFNNNVVSIPTSNQVVFAGIRSNTNSHANISKNVIGSLTNSSDANTITINSCSACSASYGTAGIFATGASNASLIDRNIVSYLVLAGTTAMPSYTAAISIDGSISTVKRNTVYSIKTSSASSEVYGIYARSLSTNTTIANNMITLGTSLAIDVPFIGIYNDVNNASTLSLFANTIAISGPGSGGNTKNTFAFYRNSSTPLNIKANLFFTNRSGGGSHFAIGTNNISNWSAGTSDYNILSAATPSNTGYFGVAPQTFASWQAITTGDLNSNNFDPTSEFISLPNGDLRIPDSGSIGVDTNIVDKGGSSPGTNVVSDDIDGAQRLGIIDIGASEVLINWLGGTSTDWFDASNWTGSQVPTCGLKDRVKIRSTINQPEINGAAEFRDMVLIEGSTVTLMSGGTLTQCSDALSPFGIVNNGSLILTGSQSITLRGDFTQNNIFTSTAGKLIFDSSTGQQLLGDDPYHVHDLTVDGGGSKITAQKVTVDGTLALTDGLLYTTASSVLTIGVAGAYTGGSTTSYAEGPIAKQLNTVASFDFPVGKNGSLRPISVTPNNTLLTTFTAEYFDDSAIGTFGAANDGSLITISTAEYWILDRAGLSDATVKLTWNNRSGVSASAAIRNLLVVAHFDGSQWNNEGGASITGTKANGSLTSSSYVNSFSPFTLGSTDIQNPLPLQLISFKAETINGRVKFVWVTDSEMNNDYFTIEGLPSGFENFEEVVRVQGSGTTNKQVTYTAWDNSPAMGESYYRLKQTDYNGKSKTYAPVAVTITEAMATVLSVYPNPAKEDGFTIDLKSFGESTPVVVSLSDLTGKVYLEQVIQTDSDGGVELRVTNILASGLYILKAYNGKHSLVDKVVIAR